jgi:hypothetical protein
MLLASTTSTQRLADILVSNSLAGLATRAPHPQLRQYASCGCSNPPPRRAARETDPDTSTSTSTDRWRHTIITAAAPLTAHARRLSRCCRHPRTGRAVAKTPSFGTVPVKSAQSQSLRMDSALDALQAVNASSQMCVACVTVSSFSVSIVRDLSSRASNRVRQGDLSSRAACVDAWVLARAPRPLRWLIREQNMRHVSLRGCRALRGSAGVRRRVNRAACLCVPCRQTAWTANILSARGVAEVHPRGQRASVGLLVVLFRLEGASRSHAIHKHAGVGVVLR